MSQNVMWTAFRRPNAPAPAAAAPLAPFDAASRGAWSWEQPARLRPHWNLTVDDAVVGTLALRGLLRRAADVRVAAGGWSLRPRFPNDVLVLFDGAGTPCVRYRPGWLRGGRIEREGRETLFLRCENFWGTRWAIQTVERLPLVHLHHRLGPFMVRNSATLELEDAARRLEDLPVLMALAWFEMLRARRSHAAHG